MKARFLAPLALAAILGVPGGVRASSVEWEASASIPSARSIPTAGAIDGLVYIAGGRVATSDCGYSTTLWVYDPVGDSWDLGPSMTHNREGATGGVIDGTLYVVGGANGCGSYLTAVEAYDADAGSWSSKTSLTSARKGAQAAVHDGKLYVFGGYGPSGFREDGEVYDPGTDSWTTFSIPRRRFEGTAATLDGRIYLIGGNDSTDAVTAVDVYDPATDSWSEGPEFPYAAVAMSAAEHGGTIYVAGGAYSFTLYADVWHLDPDANEWVEDPPLGTPRFGLSLVSTGESLVAVSGQNINAMLTVVEHYEPTATNQAPVAQAGDDVLVTCAPPSGAEVSLDGSGSTDAEDDTLTYAWSADGVVFDDPSSATPTATFPVGSTTVTLTVSDGAETDDDTLVVVVEADPPPTISAPADVTVEATGPSGQAVALGAATVSDECGTPSVTNDAPALFSLGTTVVTWTATDAADSTDTDTQSVTVVDTTDPTVSFSGLPATIKKDKDPVRLTPTVSATDVADANPVVTLVVTCNVPVAPGDVVVHSTSDVEIAAEKGRIYTFTWTATDASGNSSTAAGTVEVTGSGKDKG